MISQLLMTALSSKTAVLTRFNRQLTVMTKGGKDSAPLKNLFQIKTIWFVSRSQLQLAKCASRVALYLMREQELKEGTKDGAPGAGAGSAKRTKKRIVMFLYMYISP